jgi:hypothetical protein
MIIVKNMRVYSVQSQILRHLKLWFTSQSPIQNGTELKLFSPKTLIFKNFPGFSFFFQLNKESKK